MGIIREDQDHDDSIFRVRLNTDKAVLSTGDCRVVCPIGSHSRRCTLESYHEVFYVVETVEIKFNNKTF